MSGSAVELMLNAGFTGKDISIQEGGVGKNLNAIRKISTKKQGGGSQIWILDDDVEAAAEVISKAENLQPEDVAAIEQKLKSIGRVTSKTIKKNGTYKAEDDDVFAWHTVNVKVKGGNGSANSSGKHDSSLPAQPGGIGSSVIGKDQDGDDAVVGVDEHGNFVSTKLPVAIDIIRDPTKDTYVDGEDIDTTGIVVVLRDKNGNAWTEDQEHYPNGHIPVDELTIEPTKADSSKGVIWTDGDGVNATLITMLNDGIGDKPTGIGRNYTPNYDMTLGCGGAGATFYATQYNGAGYLYQKSGNVGNINGFNVSTREFTSGTSGMTAIGHWVNLVLPAEHLPESTKNPLNSTGELTPSGGTQTITLKWKRPQDDKELTDTFNITVNPSNGGAGGGGGGTSGGGGDTW